MTEAKKMSGVERYDCITVSCACKEGDQWNDNEASYAVEKLRIGARVEEHVLMPIACMSF